MEKAKTVHNDKTLIANKNLIKLFSLSLGGAFVPADVKLTTEVRIYKNTDTPPHVIGACGGLEQNDTC